MNEPTGIELLVCRDIARRQMEGAVKYGVTVAGNPLPLRDWLQHAYEESLDFAIYLKRAIAELDGKPDPARRVEELEEKNIKIAEAYNWTRIFPYHGNGPLWGMSPHNRFDRVPDHFSDLNAMREAEAGAGLHDRANLALRVKWVNALREIVSRQCPRNHVGAALVSDIDLLNASAADRAEAFGLALNLWSA